MMTETNQSLETGGVAIEEFVGLKPKIYSSFVDDNSEYKKAKCMIEMLLQQQVIMNIKMYC